MVTVRGVTAMISCYDFCLEGIQVDTSCYLELSMLQMILTPLRHGYGFYSTSKNKSVIIVLNVLGKCL